MDKTSKALSDAHGGPRAARIPFGRFDARAVAAAISNSRFAIRLTALEAVSADAGSALR